MGERVLFLTSNGTGLGHLTRVMAIARRLSDPEAASILTLSAAAPVAAREGFHVEYLPSHSAAAAEAPRRWDRRLRRRLENLVAELAPTVLVFDGPHPYDGLIAFLRGATRDGLRTVWLRRPMWRPGVGGEGIYWSGEFDLIVEPGELAASADCGLTADRRDEVTTVPPIVYLDPGELVPREQAERELGLDPGRVNALVALGQGESLDEAVACSLASLAADPGIQVAALESGLSPKLQIPDGVVLLEATYPVARYHHAFDLAVAAAGYNAFHELIANGVPSLFVPMPRKLDDQPARAMWAREAGVGEGVGGPRDHRAGRRGWGGCSTPGSGMRSGHGSLSLTSRTAHRGRPGFWVSFRGRRWEPQERGWWTAPRRAGAEWIGLRSALSWCAGWGCAFPPLSLGARLIAFATHRRPLPRSWCRCSGSRGASWSSHCRPSPDAKAPSPTGCWRSPTHSTSLRCAGRGLRLSTCRVRSALRRCWP